MRIWIWARAEFAGARRAGGAAATTFVLAALMAATATVGIARGTVFAPMSTEDLARAAVAILRGRCVGSIVEMRGGEIWTVTSIEIHETWKGDVPRVVRVRLLGGRAANITSHVDGVPQFRAGEDVVLFLSRSASGDFSVLSWAQGTFRVRRDPASGIAAVTQDTAVGGGALSGIALEGRRGLGGRDARANGVRSMRIDEFRREIEAALAPGASDAGIHARMTR
jgi:hypothetical protein